MLLFATGWRGCLDTILADEKEGGGEEKPQEASGPRRQLGARVSLTVEEKVQGLLHVTPPVIIFRSQRRVGGCVPWVGVDSCLAYDPQLSCIDAGIWGPYLL